MSKLERSPIPNSAKIGKYVVIEAGAIIGENVTIGHHTVIYSQTILEDNVVIGSHCVLGIQKSGNQQMRKSDVLQPNLTVQSNTKIGNHVTIYAGTTIKEEVFIADHASIRENTTIGNKTIIGRSAIIELNTTIGSHCTIQTLAYVTGDTVLEDHVFLGPCVSMSNDKYMGERPYELKGPYIKKGAKIGNNSTLLPGIIIGQNSIVGAGSVVTKDVEDNEIVVGVPAKKLASNSPQHVQVPFLDLKSELDFLRKDLNQAITEVLDSSSFVLGAKGKELEAKLANYLGASYAIGVANGTDALSLALEALKIGPGDEVITTPFTFFATAEAIIRIGANPVFVDIDPKTYNMNPLHLEKAITKKTKAVIVVHLFGQPVELTEIQEIAKKYQLKIIEDACQAIGATYSGKKVGTFGDIACFSFYPTKNLGCYGDGGLITTNDKQLANQIILLRNHGSSKPYIHEIIGINSRLDEIQAAILLVKLNFLDKWNERRQQLAQNYSMHLTEFVKTPSVSENKTHVFHQYCIETPWREQLAAYLKEKKISTGIYYPVPLHLQPSLQFLGSKEGDFTVSEEAAKHILALPIHPFLTDEQQETVIAAIKAFIEAQNGKS